MRLVSEILTDLAAANWQIRLGSLGTPKLVPTVEGATLGPALLAELKACRDNVMWWLRKQMFNGDACSLCGREFDDPEDRDRMADPAYCDRGGAPAQRRRLSGELVPEVPRCPIKVKLEERERE